MERLTVYTPNGYESINPVDLCLDEYSDINFERILDKLGAYEDFEEIFREKMTNLACDFLSDKEEFGKWIDRNRWITKKCDEWVRLEEQGRLIKLPCKVGDKIFLDFAGFGKDVDKFTVKDFHLDCFKDGETILFCDYESNDRALSGQIDVMEFGKTVFLAKSEAEAKLKELRGAE